MTFAKGAALKDPSGLFNSSLDGNVRRAIDIHEGDKVDEAALKDLIRAAVALNLKGKSKPKPRRANSNGPTSVIAGPGHGSSQGKSFGTERHANTNLCGALRAARRQQTI